MLNAIKETNLLINFASNVFKMICSWLVDEETDPKE